MICIRVFDIRRSRFKPVYGTIKSMQTKYEYFYNPIYDLKNVMKWGDLNLHIRRLYTAISCGAHQAKNSHSESPYVIMIPHNVKELISWNYVTFVKTSSVNWRNISSYHNLFEWGIPTTYMLFKCNVYLLMSKKWENDSVILLAIYHQKSYLQILTWILKSSRK